MTTGSNIEEIRGEHARAKAIEELLKHGRIFRRSILVEVRAYANGTKGISEVLDAIHKKYKDDELL